jgi:hypothetical protein
MPSDSTLSLNFDAIGNHYDIDLRPNFRLVSRLRSSGQLSDDEINIYTGSMPNVQGSWARFSLIDEYVDGLIFDGNELLIIESAGNLRGLLPDLPPDDTIVVFRASDLTMPIDKSLYLIDTNGVFAADKLIEHTARQVQQATSGLPLPTRTVSLGLVAGSEYATIETPIQSLLRDANRVDGIFSSQMDMHLRLEQLTVLDDQSDPFVGNDPAELLNQLIDFKQSTPAYAPLGLAHLQVRRDFPGNAIGIALFESVCGPRDGVGVSEGLHGVSFITMAHEIAHNFGAPHDTESGSACESAAAGFIMAPEYTGSEEFSQCSLNQMEQFLSQVSCITTVGPGELELDVEPYDSDIFYGEATRVHYFANSIGNDSLFDGHTDVSMDTGLELIGFNVSAPYRNCSEPFQSTGANCDLGNLYSGESLRFFAEFTPKTTGLASIGVSVSALNDTDMSNNDGTLTFNIQPATTLWGQVSDQINVKPGLTKTATVVVENVGDFASAGSLRIFNDWGHTLASTVPYCVQDDQYSLSCTLDTFAAHEVREVDFDITIVDDPVPPADVEYQTVFVETTTALHGSNPVALLINTIAIWGSYKDLRAEFVSTPGTVTVDGRAEFIVAAINDGPDDHPQLEIEVTVGPGERVDNVTSSDTTCTWTDEEASCSLDILNAGARVEATIEIVGVAVGRQTIRLNVANRPWWDYDTTNNVVTFDHQVIAKSNPGGPSGSGGGGGGSISIFSLVVGIFLLCCGHVMRRRRAR